MESITYPAEIVFTQDLSNQVWDDNENELVWYFWDYILTEHIEAVLRVKVEQPNEWTNIEISPRNMAVIDCPPFSVKYEYTVANSIKIHLKYDFEHLYAVVKKHVVSSKVPQSVLFTSINDVANILLNSSCFSRYEPDTNLDEDMDAKTNNSVTETRIRSCVKFNLDDIDSDSDFN